MLRRQYQALKPDALEILFLTFQSGGFMLWESKIWKIEEGGKWHPCKPAEFRCERVTYGNVTRLNTEKVTTDEVLEDGVASVAQGCHFFVFKEKVCDKNKKLVAALAILAPAEADFFFATSYRRIAAAQRERA